MDYNYVDVMVALGYGNPSNKAWDVNALEGCAVWSLSNCHLFLFIVQIADDLCTPPREHTPSPSAQRQESKLKTILESAVLPKNFVLPGMQIHR